VGSYRAWIASVGVNEEKVLSGSGMMPTSRSSSQFADETLD
jgi:hypothetical protein